MTTPPHYSDEVVTIHHGDCLDVLAEMPDASVDAIVTDPPYGLGFMGKAWDDLPPGLPWAQECLRVLKPGGHLLAFGGTRTWHRLAVAVEDAGFEMRDSIAWLHSQGFPKSLDVSKAIDAVAMTGKSNSRSWRHVNENRPGDSWVRPNTNNRTGQWVGDKENTGPSEKRDTPATPAAQQWQGWGTALKPAFEPIVVARKPRAGTVAANVLAHGTGALNIDGCRVAATDSQLAEKYASVRNAPPRENAVYGTDSRPRSEGRLEPHAAGRWPANVVLDGSQADALDEQSGSTSRFFPTFRYQAKAPTRERPKVNGIAHPTVKPVELMRWLVRLVRPPGGIVLDTFAGSGATVEACIREGFRCVAIEREAEYLPHILWRINRHQPQPHDHAPDLLDLLGDQPT